MSEKIVVPDGMLKAAYPHGKTLDIDEVEAVLEAALRWLSENPIVPNDEQRAQLARDVPYEDSGNGRIISRVVVQWQRRMFLAPAPEPVQDLIDAVPACIGIKAYEADGHTIEHLIREAYLRGQKEGK